LKQLDVEIANKLGLHARAAARFVQVANRFTARVTVVKDESRVDGKSILGLLTLAARRGCSLRLFAEGEDAADVLAELENLVRGRFGEDE
jgi:phosphocarrier protein HPr